MGDTGHEHIAKSRRALWSGLIGGVLLFINWVWQGYLNLTPGGDNILIEITHPAYFINNSMLFISTIFLLYLLIAIKDALNLAGFIWRLGIYISLLGMTLFTLGTLAFTVYGFADSQALPDVMGFITGIGNVAMYVGAFPLGFALFKGKGILKLSALLLILQFPFVIIYLFNLIQMNPLVVSVTIGGFYGLAWILVGFYLSK